MIIRSNWRPDPMAVKNGHSYGRTTKMLLKVIELAQEPQRIVVLWPTFNLTEYGYRYFLDILDANFPGEVVEADGRKRRVMLGPYEAEAHFKSITSHPEGITSRGFANLSILLDHTVDGMPHYFENGNHRHNYEQWMQAIRVIQGMCADQEKTS